MRALQRVETRRLTPERPSPLNALVEDQQLLARLRAQGKIEAAATIEASIRRLAAHMAGWPEAVQQRRHTWHAWGWKPL